MFFKELKEILEVSLIFLKTIILHRRLEMTTITRTYTLKRRRAFLVEKFVSCEVAKRIVSLLFCLLNIEFTRFISLNEKRKTTNFTIELDMF